MKIESIKSFVRRVFKIFLFTLLISFVSCQTNTQELPVDVIGQDDDNNDDDNDDGNGDPTATFPYDVGLVNWKITLPRNFSGRLRDGVLVADEVFLDASRNHYSLDPSFRFYSDEYFFLTEDEYVRFECPATDDIPTTSLNTTNTRTELREMPSNGGGETGWDATNADVKTLEFEVRVMETPDSKKLAFAQIHDYQQPVWDDLIRVQIQSDVSNAVVGDTGKILIMGDMIEGELSDGFDVDFRALNYADRVIKEDYVLGDWLHVKITVQNSTIRIFLEDMQNPIRVYENADCPSNYFKAGVYNQSISSNYGGIGIAEFREISVSENFLQNLLLQRLHRSI